MKHTYYQPATPLKGPAHIAANRRQEPPPADESGPAPLADDGAHATQRRRCPQCAEPLIRIHRTAMDRFLSLMAPVHRYRCYNFNCNWEGVLQVAPGALPRPRRLHA